MSNKIIARLSKKLGAQIQKAAAAQAALNALQLELDAALLAADGAAAPVAKPGRKAKAEAVEAAPKAARKAKAEAVEAPAAKPGRKAKAEVVEAPAAKPGRKSKAVEAAPAKAAKPTKKAVTGFPA